MYQPWQISVKRRLGTLQGIVGWLPSYRFPTPFFSTAYRVENSV